MSNLKLRLWALGVVAAFTRRFYLPGTDRFLRMIHNPDIRQTDHLDIVAKYDGHLRIHIDSSSFIEWSIFFYGYYERTLVRLMKRLLSPGCVAFDVGANIGCHTLIMSSLAGQHGKVVAIEPHPMVFKRLVDNIRLNNLSNVDPRRCALSDCCGRTTLFIPAEDDANQGKSSLYSHGDRGLCVMLTVDTVTLDSLMEEANYHRLDFLKIDVEGLEHKVLVGAMDSIVSHRPYVVFEYDQDTWKNAGQDFSATSSLFRDLSYSMYLVGGQLSPIEYPLPTWANILASPHPLKVS